MHELPFAAMAVGSVYIALQALFADRRIVSKSDFITPLKIVAPDEVEDATSGTGVGESSLVVFPIVRLREFSQSPEPTEAMAQRLDEVFHIVARFLDRRPTETFTTFSEERLRVRLFIDVWMNQDQFELNLPTELISACARQQLGIYLISNDISAEQAVAFGAT